MRKYGKWLLVLGVLAAKPAWVSADGFLQGLRPGAAQETSSREQNQQLAEHVSTALQQARLNAYDVEIEVRSGVVILEGKVRDVTHRALATKQCFQIPGVRDVQNNLKYVPSGNIQQTSASVVVPDVRHADYQQDQDGQDSVDQVRFQKPGQKPTGKPTQSGSRTVATTTRKPAPVPNQQTSRVQTAGMKGKPAAVPPANVNPPAIAFDDSQATASHRQAVPNPEPPKNFRLPGSGRKEVAQNITNSLGQAGLQRYDGEPPAVPPANLTSPASAFEASPTTASHSEGVPSPEPPKNFPLPGSGPTNQEVAQNIANSLGQAGLQGYEMEVRYDKGVATLIGQVATSDQYQAASFAASQVPHVRHVQNRLEVTGPIAQSQYIPFQGRVAPASMTNYGMQQGGMPGMGMQGGPVSMGAAGNYSNPQLPEHAWPSYAAYPNSAAVNYPTQYSASAWPYIGPFYPYPQVPLGWREVSMKWDDGFWQLDFEKKQDAWYWLFSPRNWH